MKLTPKKEELDERKDGKSLKIEKTYQRSITRNKSNKAE